MSDENTPDLTALLAEALSRGTSGRYFLDYGVTPAHLAEQITAAGFGLHSGSADVDRITEERDAAVRAVEAERDAARAELAEAMLAAGHDLEQAWARAESAEAALAGLREGIEALADELTDEIDELRRDIPPVGPPRVAHLYRTAGLSDARDRLRALLAPTPDREEARDE